MKALVLRVRKARGPTLRAVRKADWDEGAHPRAADGKFGQGGGGPKKDKPGQAREVIPQHDAAVRDVMQKEKLSPAEHRALKSYGEDGFKAINRSLRGQPPPAGDKAAAKEQAKAPEQIKNLDAAMAKSELRADTVVYRGVPGGAIGPVEIGSLISEPGYSSTSMSHDSAQAFSRGRATGEGPKPC